MSYEIYPTNNPYLFYDLREIVLYADTKEFRSISNKIVNYRYRQTPTRTFQLNYNVLNQRDSNTELESLMGFWMLHEGNNIPFLFSPVISRSSGYNVVGATLGTGDGSTKEFKMVRPLGTYYNEPIKYLDPYEIFGFGEEGYGAYGYGGIKTGSGASTPSIYLNGSLQYKGYSFVSADEEVWVSFDVAPLATCVVTASFNYFHLCRFKLGRIEAELFCYNLWALKTVELEEWTES